MRILNSFIILMISGHLLAQKTDTIDLKNYFGNFEGAFSVYQYQTDSYQKFNVSHCAKRFSPCSTFKIPNSLIGLETGVITDEEFVIKYDSISHPKTPELLANAPFKYWFQDLSLKNALKYSCLWYYQELARRVGNEKMQQYVLALDYGNGDISSGLDTYWLCGSIQISIDEQIEFLKQMYEYNLPGFSARNINIVKDIMLYETTEKYSLFGKTGSGDCWNNKVIGWYVGFVKTNKGTAVFAMNVIVNNFDDLKNNFRIELTKKVLKELKIIE